jgi:hypothetical protein
VDLDGLNWHGRASARAGVDTTVIALWLGHELAETTQICLYADLALKERHWAGSKYRRFHPESGGAFTEDQAASLSA